ALAKAVDLSSLFPRAVPFGGNWVARGAEWVETTRGIAVRANGELLVIGASGATSRAPDDVPRAATVLALFVAAIGFPLWATARGSAPHRAVVALGVALTSVAAFHLVAAGRVPAAALALPPLFLLLDTWLLHRRFSWS